MSARHLSTAERQRLVALLGMLGSDYPGERDNAAKLAEKFRRQYNMTWADLLNLEAVPTPPPPPKPEPSPQPKPRSEAPKPPPQAKREQGPPDGATYSERVRYWEASWAAKQTQRRAASQRERGFGFFWAAVLALVITALATYDPHPEYRPPPSQHSQPVYHIKDPMKAALPPVIGHSASAPSAIHNTPASR